MLAELETEQERQKERDKEREIERGFALLLTQSTNHLVMEKLMLKMLLLLVRFTLLREKRGVSATPCERGSMSFQTMIIQTIR